MLTVAGRQQKPRSGSLSLPRPIPANNMRHLAILITAVALSLTACLDSSNTHPEVALDDWGDPAELGQIAYATAEALTSSDVRANVLSAMRASVRVEHSCWEHMICPVS